MLAEESIPLPRVRQSVFLSSAPQPIRSGPARRGEFNGLGTNPLPFGRSGAEGIPGELPEEGVPSFPLKGFRL